ncbi:small nuclear ribonucleoprotein G [Cryptococcus neoformans Bt63]|nr:small nuclear ribonucleoprotein G [Cryptococcus neoformans var. grubii Bt63]
MEDSPALLVFAFQRKHSSRYPQKKNSLVTMSRTSQPELKKFMDRRLFLHLQGGRQISGVLRGYDMFLNLVVDNAFEELGGGQRKPCGMVVIRGNSVSAMELLDNQRV